MLLTIGRLLQGGHGYGRPLSPRPCLRVIWISEPILVVFPYKLGDNLSRHPLTLAEGDNNSEIVKARVPVIVRVKQVGYHIIPQHALEAQVTILLECTALVMHLLAKWMAT